MCLCVCVCADGKLERWEGREGAQRWWWDEREETGTKTKKNPRWLWQAETSRLQRRYRQDRVSGWREKQRDWGFGGDKKGGVQGSEVKILISGNWPQREMKLGERRLTERRVGAQQPLFDKSDISLPLYLFISPHTSLAVWAFLFPFCFPFHVFAPLTVLLPLPAKPPPTPPPLSPPPPKQSRLQINYSKFGKWQNIKQQKSSKVSSNSRETRCAATDEHHGASDIFKALEQKDRPCFSASAVHIMVFMKRNLWKMWHYNSHQLKCLKKLFCYKHKHCC